MAFTSFAFLGFVAGVLALYWAMPWHRARMAWLVLASAAYYMTWNRWLIGLILFSASVDYVGALLLERTTSPRRRRLLLTACITVNLGLLLTFKYANFFLDQVQAGLAILGVSWAWSTLEVLLPLGISFYTFETISYIVDVYRGRSRAVRNPVDYALFILFFPHLLAGPIVRAWHFLPQVEREKRWNWDRAWVAVQLIIRGLFKKVVLADQLGRLVVDPVFAAPGTHGTLAIWLATIAYALQVYGDFAGYSDMARGLAHLFDFRLPINFNNPYLATSPADFWRRWHISLSTWLRDYLFIPLGGNRGSLAATGRNLFLVMALGGLWHGAAWTFVLWGLYQGLLLVGHRLIPWPRWLAASWARPLCVLGTFGLMCLGWVLFRAQSLADVATLLTRLVVPTTGLALAPGLVVIVLGGLALVWLAGELSERGIPARWERTLPLPLQGLAWALLLCLTLVLWPVDSRLFIYFQF